MGETVFTCVLKRQDDKDASLTEILRLGKAMTENIDYETQICEPLSQRAYHACVYAFLQMLPSMSSESIGKYKKEILDERWNAKYTRSDTYADLGLGEREIFRIGMSTAVISEVCDEIFWQEYNEQGDFLTAPDDYNDQYANAPVLEVQKSYRAEYIEAILREKDVTISDICNADLDLHELVGISDSNSLIEDTRQKRKCGICEAVVESVFRILETWCDKDTWGRG